MDFPTVQYVEHHVPLVLARTVKAVWHLSGEGGDAAPSRIIPDGCMEIVFNFGDPMSETSKDGSRLQPRAMVVGQTLRATMVASTGRLDLWGIRLQPWAARDLLDVQARDLRNAMVSVDQLGRHRRQALGQVMNEDSSGQRLSVLMRALTELVERNGTASRPSRRLVQLAAAAAEAPSVRTLARAAGLSVRHVETLFDVHVGLSPKSVMRLARFQRALALLRAPTPVRLGRIAAECGYHDHAHFVRECREIAGVVPSEVAAAPEHLGDAFISM